MALGDSSTADMGWRRAWLRGGECNETEEAKLRSRSDERNSSSSSFARRALGSLPPGAAGGARENTAGCLANMWSRV
jgi:hypothetical protein